MKIPYVYTHNHTTEMYQHNLTERGRLHLEEGPAALLVQEGSHHWDPTHLPDSVLSHFCTGVSAGDVPQGTHGWFNDVLSTSGIVDSLQQRLQGMCSGVRE